jgi:hypothetical protein
MQVDPHKPVLKVPGSQRLKLETDTLLSIFAFKFKLCCYNEAGVDGGGLFKDFLSELITVRRCRLTRSNPMLKLPWN